MPNPLPHGDSVTPMTHLFPRVLGKNILYQLFKCYLCMLAHFTEGQVQMNKIVLLFDLRSARVVYLVRDVVVYGGLFIKRRGRLVRFL